MAGKFFLKYRWRIFLFLLFPWFFAGGPDYESTRLFKETWNLGHILFFAAFAFETDKYLTARRLAIRTKHISIMILILGVATSIELFQSFIPGRVASFHDILLGLVGGLLILIWKDADQLTSSRKIIWRLAGLTGITICIVPLLLVISFGKIR